MQSGREREVVRRLTPRVVAVTPIRRCNTLQDTATPIRRFVARQDLLSPSSPLSPSAPLPQPHLMARRVAPAVDAEKCRAANGWGSGGKGKGRGWGVEGLKGRGQHGIDSSSVCVGGRSASGEGGGVRRDSAVYQSALGYFEKVASVFCNLLLVVASGVARCLLIVALLLRVVASYIYASYEIDICLF